MFCDKCGNQIDDNITFCTNCGNPIDIDTDNREIPMENDNKSKKMPTSGGMGKYLGIAVIAAIILISVLCLMNMPVTVNLNNYVTVNTEGYDSLGKADYQFDYDSFYEDYKDKIKMQTQNGKKTVVQDWIGDTYYAVEMLGEYFKGSLSQYSGLSNGDTIIFTWKCEDGVIRELFNCNLQYKDIEVEVSGLQEIQSFDPFQDVQIQVKGVLPKGKISIKNNSSNDAVNDLEFTPVVETQLRNGHDITIQVSFKGSEESFIEEYGMRPYPMEKQYTLSGYDEYIYTQSQLTKEHLEQLDEMAYKEFMKESWSDEEKVQSVEFLGTNILSDNNPRDYYPSGEIYMIYKVKVNCTLDTDSGVVNYPIEYYYYVRFEDFYLDARGELKTDATWSVGSVSYGFRVDTGHYRMKGGQYSFYYHGFETLEELQEAIENKYGDSYNCEKNML